MSNVEPIRDFLEPVRKSVTVPCSVERAFEIFTVGFDRWWPRPRYSISQERTATVTLEPGSGGAIFEIRDDGERFEWGHVIAWDPPRGLTLAWHPGLSPDAAQEVELRFSAAGDETLVELEHRNWDRLGEEAAQRRTGYDSGWDTVFVTLFRRRLPLTSGAMSNRWLLCLVHRFTVGTIRWDADNQVQLKPIAETVQVSLKPR